MHQAQGQTWKRFFGHGLFKCSKFLLGLQEKILLKCYLHFPSLSAWRKAAPLAEKALQMFGTWQLRPAPATLLSQDYSHRAAGRESNPCPTNTSGWTYAGQGFTRHIPVLLHTPFRHSLEPKIQLNRPARYHSEKCRCFPVFRGTRMVTMSLHPRSLAPIC